MAEHVHQAYCPESFTSLLALAPLPIVLMPGSVERCWLAVETFARRILFSKMVF